jgi:uncharacterized cupin superfamily protein
MTRRRVPEAELVDTEAGKRPEGDGWFILNLAEAPASAAAGRGHAYLFEGDSRFPQFGINVHVLEPGEVSSLYHGESNQEDFLVLLGECLLLVEGEERPLRQWDFFHASPWTEHTFVGAGEGPCAILMVGTRDSDEVIVYPVNETAARHDASVERETGSPDEAYGSMGWERGAPARRPWPPPGA